MPNVTVIYKAEWGGGGYDKICYNIKNSGPNIFF